MKPADILYEPTPIGRIGVRKSDNQVFIGFDYSCFAYMLEEYISYGIVSIVIPSSFPETSVLNDFPELLKKRLKVVDDQQEQEAVARLLFGLRREFNVELAEAENSLRFPNGMEGLCTMFR
jgi:hypothetical protein